MKDLLLVAREFSLSRVETFHVREILAAAGEPDTPANCERVWIALAAINRECDCGELRAAEYHEPDETDAKIASVVEALRVRGAAFSLDDVLRFIVPPFLSLPAWEARERAKQILWNLSEYEFLIGGNVKLVRFRAPCGESVYCDAERATDDEWRRFDALLHAESQEIERADAELDALAAIERARGHRRP